MAFAFELDTAVVDTNIARVYARLAGERLRPSQVQVTADSMLPSGDGWVWNQCLMDLGAVVCRPRSPACNDCPVRRHCAWRGGATPDPAIGSAGVSGRQARFEGSDRQLRGRLMRALAAGPVRRADVASVMGCDTVRADRLVDDLTSEGLCQLDEQVVQLPQHTASAGC
jgi:A/G-specific adenine glycosylase